MASGVVAKGSEMKVTYWIRPLVIRLTKGVSMAIGAVGCWICASEF